MLNVTEETKIAYLGDSILKTLTISFPNLNITFTNEDIVSESLELFEAIESEVNLTFIGCIASQFKVQIADITTNLKGEYVEVSIRAGETDNISLFKGFVDTQTIQNYVTGICEITAYDVLYTLQNTDVAEWYNSLNWENTWSVKDFRDSLFTHLEIAQEITTLVNDDIEFTKQYVPAQLSALSVVKSICQINGVFGKIGRDGVFKYYTLPTTETSVENIEYYKSLDYQRFTTQPINRIVVRQSDQEVGVAYGNGENTFIMQGNFFTYGLDNTDLMEIAENVYPQVSGRPYVPYESEIKGYPWIEAGDILTYKVFDYSTQSYSNMNFYVLSRVLKGIQALYDTQSAEGEQYQSIFISNINAQIDSIRDQIEQISGKLNDLGLKYVMFYNERAIDIADGHRQAIASNEFAVAQASQVHIEMEYLLECTTTESEDSTYITDNDLQVTMLYEFDGVFIDSRQPKETYQDGKHILHTYYVINVPDAQPHSWRVFLECNGGSVHIDQLQAQNTILGLGTLVGDLWDGTIQAEEIIEPITFGGFIGEFTENVSVTPQTPTPATANDVIPALTFGGFLDGFTDSVEFDSSYLNFYPYDGVTTSTCTIENYKWKGAGDVTLPELTLTSNASMIADSDEGITFLISDDSGTTWYGWNGISWVENYKMSLTQFNDLIEYKGLSVIVKATLLADNYLTNIKVYGGTI